MAGFGFRGVLGTVSIVISVVDRVSRRVERIGENVMGLDSKVMKAARGFRNMGMMLTAFASIATAALGDLVTKSTEYWLALRRTGVVAGWSASQTDEMRVAATALSMEFAAFGVTQKEVAEGMYHVASAGIHEASQITSLTKTALELKAIHGVELPEATYTLVTSMKVFGYTASEVWKVANSLNYAIRNSLLTFDALSDTMKYAAPLAKLAGWSLEELMAGIMAMADAGIQGSKAGTTLRAVVTRLAAPPAAARKALRALNVELFALDDNARSIKRSLDKAGEEMARLEEQTQAVESRIKSLQATMSRFGIEERKIRLKISGLRLRAAAEDRDLTAEEEERIERLTLAAEGLSYENEVLAIQEEELQIQTDKLNDKMNEAQATEEALAKQFNAAKGAMLPLPEILSNVGHALLGMSVQERLATIEAIGGKRALAGFTAMLMAEVPALASAEMKQATLAAAIEDGINVTDDAMLAVMGITGAVTRHSEAMKAEADGTREASSTAEMLNSLIKDEILVQYGKLHKEEMKRIDDMLNNVDAMLTAIETQIVMARVMTTFYKVVLGVIGVLGDLGAVILIVGGPFLMMVGYMFAAGAAIVQYMAKLIALILTKWAGVAANTAYAASIFIVGIALAATIIGMVLYIKSVIDSISATEEARLNNLKFSASLENQSNSLENTSRDLDEYNKKLDSLRSSQESVRKSIMSTEDALTGHSLVDSLNESSSALKLMETRAARLRAGYRMLTSDIIGLENAMSPVVDTMKAGALGLTPPPAVATRGREGVEKINVNITVTTGPISGATDANELGRIIGEKVVEEIRKAIP